MLYVHTLLYTTVDIKKPAMLVNMRAFYIVVYGYTQIIGGQGGIRTPDTLFTYTRFPGVRLQPLGHLS